MRLFTFCLLLISSSFLSATAFAQVPSLDQWKIHDEDRPQPVVVTPGTASTQAQPGTPPSDAIVLFGGTNLSAWVNSRDKPAKWKVQDGHMEVVKGTGAIQTRQAFGDVQLHVEFATPNPPKGKGQGSGNSGVFFMERYEVQVLNSYENQTYPDGQASALYGQYPPLVNASRAPGEWQTYDIIFRRPHFDDAGTLLRPARVTVFHNGVLVQDNVTLVGPTSHKKRSAYKAHPDKLPLRLQDHSDPVRYRNIWVRELPETE